MRLLLFQVTKRFDFSNTDNDYTKQVRKTNKAHTNRLPVYRSVKLFVFGVSPLSLNVNISFEDYSRDNLQMASIALLGSLTVWMSKFGLKIILGIIYKWRPLPCCGLHSVWMSKFGLQIILGRIPKWRPLPCCLHSVWMSKFGLNIILGRIPKWRPLTCCLHSVWMSKFGLKIILGRITTWRPLTCCLHSVWKSKFGLKIILMRITKWRPLTCCLHWLFESLSLGWRLFRLGIIYKWRPLTCCLHSVWMSKFGLKIIPTRDNLQMASIDLLRSLTVWMSKFGLKIILGRITKWRPLPCSFHWLFECQNLGWRLF